MLTSDKQTNRLRSKVASDDGAKADTRKSKDDDPKKSASASEGASTAVSFSTSESISIGVFMRKSRH